MKKTIGMLAHVDAGKTTLSEQFLYHTGAISQWGRVDHKNAFMDCNEIEKERGITVYAEQTVIQYQGDTYVLIDTPGHVDFSQEMERSIDVLDYAILIVSGVEGVESHTETVWQLLKKSGVPVFIFINKMDRDGASFHSVVDDLQTNLSNNIIAYNHIIDQTVKEALAEQNEAALDAYLDGKGDAGFWKQQLISAVRHRQLFLAMKGSALNDEGIQAFVQSFHSLTITNYHENEMVKGRIYRIRHDEKGVRETFVKILQGRLSVRDHVVIDNELRLATAQDNPEEIHKVTQIKQYYANKAIAVDVATAGDIVALQGLSDVRVTATPKIMPALTAKVEFDIAELPEVMAAMKQLEAEDPTLNVKWEDGSRALHVSIMGIIQLQVLESVMLRRFGLTVTFGKPTIMYKEAIRHPVTGYGHFEPLKHYAEVHLKIEPADSNTGIQFKSACHTDDLTIGQQNTIRTHVFERLHRGILTGASLTDVTITLLIGRAHNKHTHGGDFREATYRAIRQGLEQADNQLLEPYYLFRIKVVSEHIGRVMSDLQKYHALSEAPQANGNQVMVTGRAPVATIMQYPLELAIFTHGKGSIALTFDGYDVCHNTEAVIEQKKYDKDNDPLYTSSSVFCTKGKGYTVKWDDAQAAMHCSTS
jgi:small GTP-binding protein